MPHIRIILEDEQGKPFCTEDHRVYDLKGGCETLDEIAQAMETFKRLALSEIEHSLLSGRLRQ